MTARAVTDGLQIDMAPPGRQAEALELVFCQFAAEARAEQVARTVAAAGRGELSLEGLLEARRGDRLVGAVWTQIRPGSAAGIWAPRSVEDESAACGDALLEAVLELLKSRGVRIVQTLVDSSTGADARCFTAAGFEHLADLLYLVCDQRNFPSSPPSMDIEIETYTAANHARLAAVVDKTYEQTLDCPQLNGMRHAEEVLAEYRAESSFDPKRWLIFTHQGHDVGCLLVTDHPGVGHCELVYMGLVPSTRGHGWGVAITHYAQWLTRVAGRDRLVLAVDAANHPAVEAYTSAGFTAWDRRAVFLKVLSGAPSGTCSDTSKRGPSTGAGTRNP